MLADVLTKAGVDATCVKLVASSAMWCLVPDARCPSTRRNRNLRPPRGMESVGEIHDVPADNHAPDDTVGIAEPECSWICSECHWVGWKLGLLTA